MASTTSDYFKALFDPDKDFFETLITTEDIARRRRTGDDMTSIMSSIINPLKDELLGKAATRAALLDRSDFYNPKVSKRYTAQQ